MSDFELYELYYLLDLYYRYLSKEELEQSIKEVKVSIISSIRDLLN